MGGGWSRRCRAARCQTCRRMKTIASSSTIDCRGRDGPCPPRCPAPSFNSSATGSFDKGSFESGPRGLLDGQNGGDGAPRPSPCRVVRRDDVALKSVSGAEQAASRRAAKLVGARVTLTPVSSVPLPRTRGPRAAAATEQPSRSMRPPGLTRAADPLEKAAIDASTRADRCRRHRPTCRRRRRTGNLAVVGARGRRGPSSGAGNSERSALADGVAEVGNATCCRT